MRLIVSVEIKDKYVPLMKTGWHWPKNGDASEEIMVSSWFCGVGVSKGTKKCEPISYKEYGTV